MNRPRLLRLVSQRAWMGRELAAALDPALWRVAPHHGLSVPAGVQPGDVWWMPGQYAARLAAVGMLPDLAAPPPNWLAVLPREFTGRALTVTTAGAVSAHPNEGFWKLADAKTDRFPAAWRTADELVAAVHSAGLPACTPLLCSPRVRFGCEYRAFVCDGRPTTGSWYIDDHREAHDSPLFDAPGHHDLAAYRFAAKVAAWCYQHGVSPRTYTLDVGWDIDGARWLVVEANPVWASGWYDAHLSAVADCLDAALNPPASWVWRPDPFLTAAAARGRPLPVDDDAR